MLLLAKASIIEQDISDDTLETIYEFQRFLYVLKTGFDKDFEANTMDFFSAVKEINQYYSI